MNQPLEGIILGSGASKPSKYRNPSAIYLKIPGFNLLLDCGEGTQKQIISRQNLTFMVDAIFISHHHMDHVYGLKSYLHTMNLLGRVTSIKIYTPDEKALKSQLGNKKYDFPLEILEVKPGLQLTQNNVKLKFFRSNHGPVPALGILVQSERTVKYDKEKLNQTLKPDQVKKLFKDGGFIKGGFNHKPEDFIAADQPFYSLYYSGDTTWNDEILKLPLNCKILHECTYVREVDLKEARKTYHTHLLDLPLEFLSRPGKIILTHLGDRVIPEDLKNVKLPPESTWAYDGLIFNF